MLFVAIVESKATSRWLSILQHGSFIRGEKEILCAQTDETACVRAGEQRRADRAMAGRAGYAMPGRPAAQAPARGAEGNRHLVWRSWRHGMLIVTIDDRCAISCALVLQAIFRQAENALLLDDLIYVRRWRITCCAKEACAQ